MSKNPTQRQNESARRKLEAMQSRLADCADAIAAILAGNPEPWHFQAIGENMTGDSYGLSFGGFSEARCPSCGVIDWTLGEGDPEQLLCPKCAELERTEAPWEEQESRQDWHDHLAEQVDTAAYEGDV
jgi:hypothetical protein